MSNIQISEIENLHLLEEDYSQAMMNILWFRRDKTRVIIFCSIELFPSEFPTLKSSEEINFLVNRKNKEYLYFKRTKISVKEALNWYSIKDKPYNMIWDDENKEIITHPMQYVQEPTFPKFNITHELPFTASQLGVVRINSTIPVDFPNEIKNILAIDKNSNWLKNNFIFDINRYSEYLGSVNLIAYNPIIRSVGCRLMLDANNEGILITIEPRSNVTLKDLKLLYAEKRKLGYSDVREIDITSNVIYIKSIGEVEEVAHAIICKKRGLIEYQGFYPFIKSIQMSMGIASETKKVEVPDRKDLSKVGDSYKTETFDYNDSFIKIEENNKDLQNKLRYQIVDTIYKRKASDKAKELGQKIFYNNDPKANNTEEAKKFVRDLISKARKEVWIIDPYFSVSELFSFAYATSNRFVKTKILTSNEMVGKKQSGITHGELLYNNIHNQKENIIETYVMTGKQAIFHDRFIIIDGNVWFSGNSLGTIGERISVIIKLPDPDTILLLLEKIKSGDKIIKLEEWIKNKKGTKNE